MGNGSSYLTTNVTGGMAKFPARSEVPIRSLKAYFKPIQAGSGDPSPTNVREITGWKSLYVDRACNNMLPNTLPANAIHATTKDDKIVSAANAIVFAVPCEKNTDYTFCQDYYNKKSWGFDFATKLPEIGDDVYGGIGMTYRSVYTANSGDCTYILINPSSQAAFDAMQTNGTMIMKASDRIVINVNWSSAGTVYGGYVDLISGDVVADTVLVSINENSEIVYYNSNAHGVGRADYNLPYTGENMNLLFCNKMTPRTRNSNIGTYPAAGQLALSPYNSETTKVVIGSPNIEDTSQEAWLSWLETNGPIEFVYKIATPITVTTLTPIELNTLRGINYIWSTSNDVTSVDFDLLETMNIQEARKRIMADTPHLETTTPSGIATFNTLLASPLKNLRAYFAPVQEGSGDPSPTNVRAISGWTGLNVCKAGSTYVLSGHSSEWGDGYVNAAGNISAPGSELKEKYSPYIAVTGGVSYTFDYSLSGTPASHKWMAIAWYKGTAPDSLTFITRNTAQYSDTLTHSSPSDATYARITMRAYGMLEWASFGQTSPTVISVDWTTEAGTVYGGYVDIITGELVVTHKVVTFENATGEGWRGNGTNGYAVTMPSNVVLTQTPMANYMLSMSYGSGNRLDAWQCCLNSAGTYFLVKPDMSVYSSLTLWEEYLSNNPLVVAFEMVTPTSVASLTPQQINAINGINNIWTSANGNVSAMYWTH